MISGREALARIEQAIAQARRQEAELDGALRSATDEAGRLRAERMDSFRALARLKLDAMTRDGVVQDLDAAERRALDLLADSRRATEGLLQRRREAEAAEQRAEAERHARAAALEQALAAIGDLRVRVEAEVRGSPEGAAQQARIEALARVADEADRKAVQAEADREEKRKPYEADPLFMYLWRRKFGTSEDRSGPLVRFFDRRVARLIGYDKARANYVLLNEIPVRLREHAQRAREAVEAERERVAALERTALEKAGIEALAARARDARQALQEAERTLAQARSARAALDREHDTALVRGDMASYREAIDLLASSDARQDLRELHREAARTPTPEDEAILRRIEAQEAAIGRAEQAIGAIRGQLRNLAQRRAALERERDEFRRHRYDSPYGGFGNEQVLANVIGGILGGVLGGTVLRDALRDGYHRQPGPWDSDFGGGWSFPTDSGGAWGDGDQGDRDGFGTGGTF